MLLLLDRDGVLNENREDYVKSPDELRLLPRAADALARFNRAGWQVALCSNQSAVGRGIITAATLDRIHDRLRDELARAGARLDAIYVATDAPHQATPRRKPGPGMLIEAMERFRASPADCVMVGDALGDMMAARAAGDVRRVLVRTGHGAATQAAGLPSELAPIAVCEDFWAAADLILGGE